MTDVEAIYGDAKDFLENGVASRQAAKPIKKGAVMGLRFTGFDDAFHITRGKEGFEVHRGAAQAPDWVATLTPTALAQLRALSNPDIGDLGVEILRRMAHGYRDADAEDAIHIKVTSGFFTIMRNGYLGVLPLGGPKVAKWLGQNGLKSVSGIKRVFQKLRSGE